VVGTRCPRAQPGRGDLEPPPALIDLLERHNTRRLDEVRDKYGGSRRATPEDEELRAWLVDAGEAARLFLEARAGETLMDPTDLEMRGHCEAVVAFDDGLRPEMTMAELADHFDAIQRLAEARADATLRRVRQRADESGGTPK
jgi:hypothetical protein